MLVSEHNAEESEKEGEHEDGAGRSRDASGRFARMGQQSSLPEGPPGGGSGHGVPPPSPTVTVFGATGGGGPGGGPTAVREHLAPFLPSHPLRPEAGPIGRGHADGGVGPVSGAPWGSAGILPIPWAYIRMMGPDGLLKATQVAILGANYIARRLADSFPVLYTGAEGLVAHECILDLRGITAATGVTVDDVAKRLIDYGFHAPTMSFPVAGTLMVEPTESENLAELDRFIDAMVSIRAEIDRVASGEWPADDSPLRNAPHTADCLIGEWSHPYPARLAAYPLETLRRDKYWAPVRRIDGAFGDRNLVCSCPRPEEFATA